MITSTDPAPATTNGQVGFNATYVWMISFVAAMGGLLFGYDWVVIGGAAKFYEAFFHLKDTAAMVAQDAGFWAKVKANAISPTGWAQSCALLGCLAGALLSGALSDRFGRKPLLILAAPICTRAAIHLTRPDGGRAEQVDRRPARPVFRRADDQGNTPFDAISLRCGRETVGRAGTW